MPITYQYNLNYSGIKDVKFTSGLDSLFFKQNRSGSSDKQINLDLINKWFLIYLQSTRYIEHEIIIFVERIKNTDITVKMAVSKNLPINTFPSNKEDIHFFEGSISYDDTGFSFFRSKPYIKIFTIQEDYIYCTWTMLVDKPNIVTLGNDENIIHNLGFPVQQTVQTSIIDPKKPGGNNKPGTFLGGKRRHLRKSRKPRHKKTRRNKTHRKYR